MNRVVKSSPQTALEGALCGHCSCLGRGTRVRGRVRPLLTHAARLMVIRIWAPSPSRWWCPGARPSCPGDSYQSVPSPIDRGDDVAVPCVACEGAIIGEFRRTLLPVAELGQLVGRDPSCAQCLALSHAQLTESLDRARQCGIGHQPSVKDTFPVCIQFSETRVRIAGHTLWG